jgi:hypothetical protein
MKTQRKKIKFGFLALIYALTLIPQKQVQANPLAIAIPSAAVATYTALTAITVGSVYVFATVNTPNITGIAWDSLRMTNVAPTAVSDLARVIEADSTLKVALTGLQSSYHEVIAGIELAYADGATTVDRAPIAAFYSQVQNTCAAFPGRLNCAAQTASFESLLHTCEMTLLASGANIQLEKTQAIAEMEVFQMATANDYSGDCRSSDLFNSYNQTYNMRHSGSISEPLDGSGSVTQAISLIGRKGVSKLRCDLWVTFNPTMNKMTYSFDLPMNIERRNEPKFQSCLENKIRDINTSTCRQKMQHDFCKKVHDAQSMCRNRHGNT